MEFLIVVVISGLAVGFSTELIGTVVERFTSYSARILKQILSAPFGALYAYLLGVTGWSLLVGGLASGFLALVIMFFVNRPVQIQQVISQRR